ncbi:MAG: Tol-Pal system beta propeller repeat protein TolB [Xanthomonadales bacterium]|nr:Tol-Pal system beta propeller repeat protein TolB [Xanthomonadales bacterium]
MMRFLQTCVAMLGLLFTVPPAFAQLSIDIIRGEESATPITVVPFGWESAGFPDSTDLAEVVGNDLTRTGQFRALPRSDIFERPTRADQVNYGTYRQLKQDYVVVGRVQDGEDNSFRVEFELLDVTRQDSLLALAVSGRPGDLRATAHQIADLIYEKITGQRGAFFTRIAYITAKRQTTSPEYAIWIADSDGFNPQRIVWNSEPFLSPAWSPDGRYLAYVTFEHGGQSIYMHEVSTGSRRRLTSYKGINGAPAFSPDGRSMALTLSKDGNPEIFVMDIGSGRLTKLTSHYSIDTEPVWMPGGQEILFTSDRAGKPQIYRVPASGGNASRVTSVGDYNARANVSYDGRKIAMVQGNKNVYRIAVLDRERSETGTTRLITPGPLDESPSFAPNGSMILYAAREGAQGVLYAASADGLVRQRLTFAEGDVREPAWGPFRPR